MRKEIEALIFSDVSSYDIYVNTGVNQGLIGDIKDGYLTIDSMPMKFGMLLRSMLLKQ